MLCANVKAKLDLVAALNDEPEGEYMGRNIARTTGT